MSSKPRLCACLRACARIRVVLSSSMVTRRPRSEIRSMNLLRAFPFHIPSSFARSEAAKHPAHARESGLLRSARNDDGGSPPRPALPHAELEGGEVGGAE